MRNRWTKMFFRVKDVYNVEIVKNVFIWNEQNDIVGILLSIPDANACKKFSVRSQKL